jgi:hypothetical protein
MPHGIWEIDGRDVIHLRPDPGGVLFTAFVDDILVAAAQATGVPLSKLHQNLRTNRPDGGVDTALDTAISDRNGWCDFPTAWQFKSADASTVTEKDLKEEVSKDHAAELIRQGYAYRFCICDELTDSKRKEWEAILLAEAKTLIGSAAVPRVLTASDLAKWACDFPSVILGHFQPQLATLAQGFQVWGSAITDLTRTFVPVAEWRPIGSELRAHLSFSNAPAKVVFSLKGVAGVGKTRFVYEVLNGFEGARLLVVYAQERHAELARFLSNRKAVAILVADECPPEIEVQLEEMLRGHIDRIRVVTIRNDARAPIFGSPEYLLVQMSEVECEQVLASNFPEVSGDARRTYSQLCRGFIRLAADMCERHALIAQAGHTGPALDDVRKYYESRIQDEQDRKAVEALALMPKVGYAEDVSEQLDQLCKLVGLDVDRVIEVAKRLHDRPGFVAKTTRFLYVTPQIIAEVAFAAAWRRWIEENPKRFLERLHPTLLADFQERVRTTALPNVRQIFAQFFFQWVTSLKSSDLRKTECLARLMALVEIEPETYLDCLHRLVIGASDDEIVAIGNEPAPTASRRNLVWLLERLAWFPEYFDRSEEILLRLAVNETEPAIGNSSSGIWLRLYAAVLPGTAVPYELRLRKLRHRLEANDHRVSSLAFKALEEILNVSAFRLDVTPLAGRVRPPEANPRTELELKEHMQAGLSLLADLAASSDRALKTKAQAIAARNSRTLLQMGQLARLQQILETGKIEKENLAELLGSLDEFLYFEGSQSPWASTEYIEKVRAWRRALQPSDLHARLLSTVGIEPWRSSAVREGPWREELKDIARALVNDRNLLDQEIPWLFSAQAKGAAFLGEELAKFDSNGALLGELLQAAVRYKSGALARGYLIGVLPNPSLDLDRLNSLLDSVESVDPSLAADLVRVGGLKIRAAERTIRLVSEGKLPLVYLRSLAAGYMEPDLPQLRSVLGNLIREAEKGNVTATEIALDICGYRIGERGDWQNKLEDPNLQDLVWRLATAAASNTGRESYWWGELVQRLGKFDLRRALGLAAKGLLSTEPNQSHVASAVLSEMAKEHPAEVMEELGSLILDNARGGWRILMRKYPIFAQLPWQVVADWVKRHGVAAARRIAGHLPAPHLDKNGSPVVPELTAYILDAFADDEEVFRSFAAGVHNLQLYKGKIASQHEQEAEVAKKFLNHPLERVRQWASLEIKEATAEANYWRRVEEETYIP